jgi:hypothetical protein
MTMCFCACLRFAGCPSVERNVLTTPTGGASPTFAPLGAEAPFAQPRHQGRADDLKRRRKARDEFLGREGQLSQSPSRKGRRQTLFRCLVQPAWGRLVRPAAEVDASLRNESLHPLAERQATRTAKKLKLFSQRPGCALLTFETI